MESAFDKIIGYQKEKEELMRICDVLKRHEEYEKLGVKIPRGLMFVGHPGVGKTLMAKCLIAESGCKCIEIRKDSAKSDFVDKISNAFERAKAESEKGEIVIILLDDLDKFSEGDGEVGGDKHSEEYAVVQAGIESVKGSKVFVVATVNNKYELPLSLYRKGRFDKIIYVGKPTHKESRQLLEFWLKSKAVDVDFDEIEMLSKFLYESTGSEIESFIDEAGTYAVYDGRTAITFDDLSRAYARICKDFDVRFPPNCSRAKLERVAYHEAGHATLGLLSKSAEVTMVCLGNSGDADGITCYFYNSSDLPAEKEHVEDSLLSLGGKAAEQVAFGDASTGCSSDLHNVGRYLTRDFTKHATNGFNCFIPYAVDGETAPALYDRISVSISDKMQELYNVACDLLSKNRPLLDAIASALIKKNYLTMPEIYSIFDDYKKHNTVAYIQV